MRAVTRLFGLVVVGAMVASSAQAQTCAGNSSLQTHKMNVTGFVWLPDGGKEFGGQLNLAAGSLFLGAGAGISKPDVDGADSQTFFQGMIGIEKSTSSGIAWCPMGTVSYASPEGATIMGLGAALGLAKEMGSGSVKLVPFGHIGFERNSFKVDECGLDDCTTSSSGIEFGAGLGFRFASGIQLSPQLSKSKDVDMVFGATISLPFGKK